MSHLGIVENFVSKAQLLKAESELFELMRDTIGELGFAYFALVHHVDLRRPAPWRIRLENYPAGWSEYFIENGLYADDPVQCACLTSNMGFAWDELPRKIVVTNRHRAILETAARYGLGAGYTVPVNIPGERSGSCSFATERGLSLPVENLLLAQLIGGFAFQTARRLTSALFEPIAVGPRLSPRQRDCLLLMMQGKTDKEIGRTLGRSPETVNQHIEMARKRYGVATRAQLLVRAIYDGQISFTEALDGQFPNRGE